MAMVQPGGMAKEAMAASISTILGPKRTEVDTHDLVDQTI